MYYQKYRILLTHPQKGQFEALEVEGLGNDGREIGRDKETLAKKINTSNEAISFYGESAQWLRDIFNDNNIENTVKIEEQGLPKESINQQWERVFTSELDFKEYSYENGEVSIQYSTQGLLTQIESQFKEKFSFNRSESVLGKNITLPSEKQMLLAGRQIYKYSELQTEAVSLEYGDENFTTRNFPVGVKTKSDDAVKGIFSVLNFNDGFGSQNMFYDRVSESQTLKLNISGSFYTDNGNVKVVLRFYTYDAGGGNYSVDFSRDIEVFQSNGPNNTTLNYRKELNVNLNYDESLSLEFETEADTEIGDVTYNIQIEEYSLFEDTNNKVMTLNDIGEGLIRIITGKSGLFKSDYLTIGKGEYLVGATGLMIRNFPKLEDNEPVPYAYITTSMQEFFEHLLAADNITWGIETVGNKEYLRVEPVQWFLDRKIAYSLPNKVEVKTTPANDFIYSSVTLGFEDVLPYEEVTGLDETNASSTWTLPVTKTDNAYDLLSPYRMDSNGAELARRRQYNTNPTRDTPFDKKIFVFDAFWDGSKYQVRNSDLDFTSITGLITPDSSYNLRYTPAQIMRRHSNFFLGGIRKIDGLVRFASGEGNTKLQTVSFGVSPVTVNESQNWEKSELSRPLFNGEIYEFTHLIDDEILKAIEAKFYSLWEFESAEGIIYRGFIYNVKIRTGEWQILGHR